MRVASGRYFLSGSHHSKEQAILVLRRAVKYHPIDSALSTKTPATFTSSAWLPNRPHFFGYRRDALQPACWHSILSAYHRSCQVFTYTFHVPPLEPISVVVTVYFIIFNRD